MWTYVELWGMGVVVASGCPGEIVKVRLLYEYPLATTTPIPHSLYIAYCIDKLV